MSKAYTKYLQDFASSLEGTKEEAFSRFGYGWQRDYNNGPKITHDDVEERFEDEYFYLQDLGYGGQGFRIEVPVHIDNGAKCEIIYSKSDINFPFPVCREKKEKLIQRFGPGAFYDVQNLEEVDQILASGVTGEQLGWFSVSLSNCQNVLREVIPVDVDDNFVQLSAEGTAIFFDDDNAVHDPAPDLITEHLFVGHPLLFHLESGDVCWDECVVSDNQLLYGFSEVHGVSLECLIQDRTIGRSLVSTVEDLRIEVMEDWWEIVCMRDRIFPVAMFKSIARKLGGSVAALAAGVYARAGSMGINTRRNCEHPLWLLLECSLPIISPRYVGNLQVYFDVHRSLLYGMYQCPWFEEGVTPTEVIQLRQSGFSIIHGGVIYGGVYMHLGAWAWTRERIDPLDIFYLGSDWFALLRYLGLFYSKMKKNPRLLVLQNLWRNAGALGMKKGVSKERFYAALGTRRFMMDVYELYAGQGIVPTDRRIVLETFGSYPITFWFYPHYKLCFKLSNKYGGVFPHEIVVKIMKYLRQRYEFSLSSYNVLNSWSIKGEGVRKVMRDMVSEIEDENPGRLEHRFHVVLRNPDRLMATIIQNIDGHVIVPYVGSEKFQPNWEFSGIGIDDMLYDNGRVPMGNL